MFLSSSFCGAKGEVVLEEKDEFKFTWNRDTMSQAVRSMKYAVRGQIVMKADTLAAQGKEIYYTNIGNPQAVGQKPNTYYRQVMALCDLPNDLGVDNVNISMIFPKDVVERAKTIKSQIGPSGTGAYTSSQGVLGFRQDVVHFIEKRDGHKSHPENIFLTNGASSAIDLVMTSIISGKDSAVMIPIPQYPIYSAILTRLGGQQVGYYLDEENNWSVSKSELELRLKKAKHSGLNVKALVIINPGNPTGQVFSQRDLVIFCEFCAKYGIVLLADEVYQKNVYSSSKTFISAKKVAVENKKCHKLQLISFHSTSKGVIGECGRRGGYMELHHIDPFVHNQLYKLASSGLCSNVPGQIMTSLMVSPAKIGDPSHKEFVREEKSIFNSLKRKAAMLVKALNNIEGIECNPAEGAMYVFPRLANIPKKALAQAKDSGMTIDAFYAMSLLEETGICVVPASGFGQRNGRIGFRTTFLLPDDQMSKAVEKFASHHKLFCKKYA